MRGKGSDRVGGPDVFSVNAASDDAKLLAPPRLSASDASQWASKQANLETFGPFPGKLGYDITLDRVIEGLFNTMDPMKYCILFYFILGT